MNIQNLSKEDLEWLLGDYNKIRQYGKVSNWVDDHVRCLALIKGSWSKPSCNCEWAALARIASSTYEQYEQQLKDQLASYESRISDTGGSQEVTRGRKKKIEG